MKKLSLADPIFNGMIGGMSRRAVANEMLLNRYIFQTPIQGYIEKGKNYLFIAGIILLVMLSAMAITKWQTWDIAERHTVQSIYQGNKEQVEENKKAAFKKYQIAGAGDNTVQSIK